MDKKEYFITKKVDIVTTYKINGNKINKNNIGVNKLIRLYMKSN